MVFQLDRDLKKIVQRTGTYDQKARNYYLDEKRNVAAYNELNINITKQGTVKPVLIDGAQGGIANIAKKAESISWRATTKPDGIIAQKRV